MNSTFNPLCASSSCVSPGVVLIVDDEEVVRNFMADAATDVGLQARTAATTEQCLGLLEEAEVDFVITDLRVPCLGGMELLKVIRRKYPRIKTTVLTAYGTIENAIEAIRIGASGFLSKPITLENLQDSFRRMIGERQDEQGLRELFSQSEIRGPGGLLGRSAGMQRVFSTIKLVCDQNFPVLISGETGTGKELVARAIHLSGNRRSKPFVPVDCAALTPSLVESELFGHAKGAFTGADKDMPGLLRAAMDGTIFLDEIGELPIELQAKLLRTLQEREVRWVGSTVRSRFEARVISATNRDLQKEVAVGRFRQDLYFRLNVVQIELPPLRKRGGDIPLLALHFLEKHRHLRRDIRLTKEAISRLMDYAWPGNVRELENTILRCLALSAGSGIRALDIPLAPSAAFEDKAGQMEKDNSIKGMEWKAVCRALEAARGSKIEAARLLGIGKTTIYRWLKNKHT